MRCLRNRYGSIGHELIRTELRYTEPKLERIDYYATAYECPKCKETEEPQFIKDEGKPALIPEVTYLPVLRHM